MTKLRFTRAWRGYRTGQVVDISGGLATQLLAQGVARKEPQQGLIETAALDVDAETADATPRRRGRRAVQKPDQTDRPGR